MTKHIKTKRPYLAKLLNFAESILVKLLETSNVDYYKSEFNAIYNQIPKALKANKVKASLDNLI